jgi:hypothetical protein
MKGSPVRVRASALPICRFFHLRLMAIYNGHAYKGSPRDTPLAAHAQIQLEVGRPLVSSVKGLALDGPPALSGPGKGDMALAVRDRGPLCDQTGPAGRR